MEETKFRPKTEEDVLLEETILNEKKEKEKTGQHAIVESAMKEVIQEKERGQAREAFDRASEEVLKGQIEDVFKSAEVKNKSEKEAEARKKSAAGISWEDLAKQQKEEEEKKDKESWF